MTNSRQRKRLRQRALAESKWQEEYATTGKGQAMERRAIANGWLSVLEPERMAAVLERQFSIATEPGHTDRARSIAAGLIVRVVGQVMQQEARDAGIDGQQVMNVNVEGPSVQDQLQAFWRMEPEFIDWKLDKTMREHGIEPMTDKEMGTYPIVRIGS